MNLLDPRKKYLMSQWFAFTPYVTHRNRVSKETLNMDVFRLWCLSFSRQAQVSQVVGGKKMQWFLFSRQTVVLEMVLPWRRVGNRQEDVRRKHIRNQWLQCSLRSLVPNDLTNEEPPTVCWWCYSLVINRHLLKTKILWKLSTKRNKKKTNIKED